MINKITFFAFLLFSASFFAQVSPVGHLTIFSEDGDKFYLILNGESQNDIPQTNLRVEDLNQPYYNVKILFEDKSLMEISKNSLMITDVDGVFSDVTYKIKRDKNNKGKMKLNYFSAIPVRQGYVAPSNVYVMHYGAPREVVVQQSSGNVTQTTTTTTSSGQGVNVGVNVGGINMGVSINDTMGGGVVTQTTTTTHSSTINQGNGYQNEVVRGCNGKYPMAARDFSSALKTVSDQGFDETKLKIAKQIASANCLSVDQIMQIANTFGFEESKLDFAKFAYDYCTEPKNYFKLNGIFSFSSNVDDLTDYIQGRN